MTRRKEDDGDIGSIDFKQMMKTPLGKWFFAPAIMAILAIAAWGLVLTLLQLQNGLPTWVYSVPGFPTVAIYYTIQLRKAWHLHIKPEINIQPVNKGVGKQTVKGNGIAPNIQGDNNVIHQTINQYQPPPNGSATATVTPSAPPPQAVPAELPVPAVIRVPQPEVGLTQPSIRDVVVELKERKPLKEADDEDDGPEILHAGAVKVPAASHESIPFDLEKGDVIKGSVLSNATVFAFILSERAYATYWKNRETGSARMLCDDDLSAQFRWKAPRNGRYYFVLDTFGKQATRNVWVQLELVETIPA